MQVDPDQIAKARSRLLDEIQNDARDTRSWTGFDGFSEPVMAAMEAVPRHAFVPEELLSVAWANRPQCIGHGQTISQPYIVALMSELLAPGPTDRILEVGTGSGYQTAVLSRLAGTVYSIEFVSDLGRQARNRLAKLGYGNAVVRIGDGCHGWPEEAPFDRIMVTAAPSSLPEALIEQLRPGGRIVYPVGPAHGQQQLMVGNRRDDGTLETRGVLAVAFVPLVTRDPESGERRYR